MLASRRWGSGRPLSLVHGFTQTSASWGPFGARLGSICAVTALDAPGHGGSSAVAAGLDDGAELIAAAGGPGAYLGYSMGARFALVLALRRPELVERLVLVSASAGIDDPVQRAQRRAADEELAQRVEAEGVEKFVTWWLGRPMWRTLPAAAAAGPSRLDNTPAGLASSLRRAGAGCLEPLWDRLGSLRLPVLVVAGALDETYAAHARRLADALPDARLALVPDAGHACHLERPDAVWEAVAPFLT